jgi:hypothetical protein
MSVSTGGIMRKLDDNNVKNNCFLFDLLFKVRGYAQQTFDLLTHDFGFGILSRNFLLTMFTL